MSLSEFEKELMSFDDFKSHKILSLYIPPILLVVGTIGNMLSFCVLMQKEMRKTSTYIYLAVIALTDIIVLYIGLLRRWIRELTGTELKNSSDFSCKIINFLGYSLITYSVWLIIAVTVERYIVTVHSLHAVTMCTPNRALKIITGLLIIFLSVHSHFLWTSKLGPNNTNTDRECLGADGYEKLIDRIWPWVDIFLYCLIPFVIIILLNCLTIYKVIESYKKRSSLAYKSKSLSSRGLLTSSGNRLTKESTRITIMLFSISLAFLICTLPMCVLMIKLEIWSTTEYSKKDISRYYLFRTVSELLMYTNHSINFYLYLLTGKKFRQQLINMRFLCKKSQASIPEKTKQEIMTCKAGRGPVKETFV